VRSRVLGPALVTAALLLVPASARAEATVSTVSTVSTDEYVHRLEAARTTALAAASAPSADRMREVRDRLGLPLVVVIMGQPVRVDEDPFLEALRGESAEQFDAAASRLAVLASQARKAARRSVPPRSRLRTALDRAYRNLGSAHPGFLQRLRRAVDDFLQWALGHLFSVRGPQTLFAWLVVIALLLPLVPLARRLGIVPERGIKGLGGRPGLQTDWYALADEALARGDLRTAVPALYAALLSTLSARGLVTGGPSLTAGECRRAVAGSRPRLYPLVETATVAYERVAYGRMTPAPRDVQLLREAELAARAP
jgi:Domain of unknown function (DUF4129)